MANLKKKIYENLCCFMVLLLVMCIVYLFASLTFAKSSPLLDYAPKPNDDNAAEVLIWVKTKDEHNVAGWIHKTDNFIKPFVSNRHTNRVHCDFNNIPSPGKFCVLNIQNWPACSAKMGYGFPSGTPCIFLELNPESDWLPDYFENLNDLPKKMPEFLRDHILHAPDKARRQVWISCEGKTPVDEENIGPITYVPYHGYPSFFYPAKESIAGYSKPLVAIQFENPKRNIVIKVECRAWAKNIPSGSQAVNFELFVE